MKLIEMNWNPDTRQLRQFGWIALAALPLLGWLWSGGNPTVTAGLAGAGLALALAAQLAPRALKPVFLGVSLAAIPVGILVGETIIALLFVGLFVPLGIVFRLIGRDSLQREFITPVKSYWQPRKQPAGPESYLRIW
jgi:hypothetical protein